MARGPYPLAAVTDAVYEIIVQGSLSDGGGGAKKAYNVFYYRRAPSATPVNKASLATIFGTTVLAPLRLATHTRYNSNSVRIRNVQDVSDKPKVIAAAGAGVIATDSMPSDDAVVCTLESVTRGKMCQGNKHFAGGAEISTTLDLLNDAGVALWTVVRGGLQTILVDADGNTYTPFVLSRTWSRLKAPVQIFGANVTVSTLLKTIGTMRKRRTPTVYA